MAATATIKAATSHSALVARLRLKEVDDLFREHGERPIIFSGGEGMMWGCRGRDGIVFGMGMGMLPPGIDFHVVKAERASTEGDVSAIDLHEACCANERAC